MTGPATNLKFPAVAEFDVNSVRTATTVAGKALRAHRGGAVKKLCGNSGFEPGPRADG